MFGPYNKTLSRNQYIVLFIDIYSRWSEGFPIRNKKSESVSHLLVKEIFTRFGVPLQLVSDKRPGNINKIMKWNLEELNVHHVNTSFHHPLYINQMIPALRFNWCEATKFSSSYLLYGRGVILPLDNILKPHQLYSGDEHDEIAPQDQHRAFTVVRSNLKKAKSTSNR